MDDATRTTLETPFPPDAIRTRKGTFGKELAYAEVHNYIARLNQAFAGDWSFTICEYRIMDNEVLVLAELAAGDTRKTAFGCSSITTTRDGGEVLSIGDDLKAAASDALKKCASLLGLGLHLYGKNEDPVPERREGPAPVPFSGNPESKSNNGQATPRQLNAIKVLAEKSGMTDAQLRTRVLDVYGEPLDKLDRRAASELISQLNNNVNGHQRAAGGAA